MPILATALLGIAGQAAWKLVTYLYDRFTAPASQPAPTPAGGTSFESSLSAATSARAVAAAPTATAAPAVSFGSPMATATATPMSASMLPPSAGADAGSLFARAESPALSNVIDRYHRMAEVQAP